MRQFVVLALGSSAVWVAQPGHHHGAQAMSTLSDTLFDDFSYCFDVGGTVSYIGDGYCDLQNTNEECEYDGGDCCSCTCEDTDEFACGVNAYECLDPMVTPECVEESGQFQPTQRIITAPGDIDPYPECTKAGGIGYFVGDGDCDEYNSNEICLYDGGDCCVCTCTTTINYFCGDNGGYDCQDPSVTAECREASDKFLPSDEYGPGIPSEEYPDCESAGGYGSFIGDGDCDFFNSVEECGYDGGDCCICTCEPGDDYFCDNFGGYNCQDPSVSDECREESDNYEAPPAPSPSS